ncbi:hypothetical protein C9I98_25765 [Photobacterium sanctipauli]|uniref:MSHA biogenesis protein MshK n=1 Tax=Photobacterium sanctipauli TaxID=1342794 RepID=A0A2T3N8G0_9GAMM|nr:hypothetical protein [Photobacterium sanctipauli]PSW09566.1 hypothetical protein C9I98_25765 [Photobacterium sanctipauli]
MNKQHLTAMAIAITALATSSSVLAQRDIQEKRQEARQEARIEHRTEARIENRRNATPQPGNIIIIQNAMLRTVSYNGIVLLHDTVNQRFYRSADNGYKVYNVPYGAKIVELSSPSPMNITLLN